MGKVVKFALSFWSNSNDCMARLGTNMTEYAPEMKLYIILATLENFKHWNQILLIMKIKYSSSY